MPTSRLITLDAESAQITHEALLHTWPLLSDRLAQDRHDNLIRQDLDDDAAEWACDHDPGRLYRGGRLSVARGWATRHPQQLSPAAADFLAASLHYDAEIVDALAERERRAEAADRAARRTAAESATRSATSVVPVPDAACAFRAHRRGVRPRRR